MTSTLIANLVFSPPFPANSDSLDPFSSFFHPLQLVKDKRVWAVALVWVVSNSLLAAKFRNYAGIDKTRSLSWSSILGWPVRVQFAIHTEWLTGQMTHREAKSSKKLSYGHVVWVTAVKKAGMGLTPIPPCTSKRFAGSLRSWKSWYSWTDPGKKAGGTLRWSLRCWEINEIPSSSHEVFIGYGREGTGSIICKGGQGQKSWANSGHGHSIPGLLWGGHQRMH